MGLKKQGIINTHIQQTSFPFHLINPGPSIFLPHNILVLYLILQLSLDKEWLRDIQFLIESTLLITHLYPSGYFHNSIKYIPFKINSSKTHKIINLKSFSNPNRTYGRVGL